MDCQIANIVSTFNLPLSFIIHVIIFIGGLYVAIHSRIIPNWLSTCLWYVGLASLFVSVTIGIEYTIGPSFPMSYTNLGQIAELLDSSIIALTISLMFGNTLYNDLKNKKNRSINNKSTKI